MADGLERRKPLQRRASLQRTEMDRRPRPELVLSRQEYAEIREGVFMRDWGGCIAEIRGVCTGRAQACHHRYPRGMGGSTRNPDVHDPAALLSLCDACHRWIENHRTDAEGKGWIVRRGVVDLEEVVTRWHGGWVQLTSTMMTLTHAAPPPEHLL